jgi:hypothetical protein
LIDNLFNLNNYHIAPISALDIVDKSLGIYRSDEISSVLRTINPFFWILQVFYWFGSIPFKLLANAGFNAEKIANTFGGKILKLLFEIIGILAAILTILQILGYSNLIQIIKERIDTFFLGRQDNELARVASITATAVMYLAWAALPHAIQRRAPHFVRVLY